MKALRFLLPLCLILAPVQAAPEEQPAKLTAKEGLQPFNDLIGSWKATGTPEGSAAEKRKGFWAEGIHWKWKFKGKDVYLLLNIDEGKHFIDGELRYLPDTGKYEFKAITADKKKVTYEGTLNKQVLTLERVDEETKEAQRLVFKMLHDNRYLYHFESKPADKTTFRKIYEVGAIKKGVDFAGPASDRPECVVSGGLGTMKVSYKGTDYYVCCTGCRNAFNEDPEKYIKEFNEKKKKKEVEKK